MTSEILLKGTVCTVLVSDIGSLVTLPLRNIPKILGRSNGMPNLALPIINTDAMDASHGLKKFEYLKSVVNTCM